MNFTCPISRLPANRRYSGRLRVPHSADYVSPPCNGSGWNSGYTAVNIVRRRIDRSNLTIACQEVSR